MRRIHLEEGKYFSVRYRQLMIRTVGHIVYASDPSFASRRSDRSCRKKAVLGMEGLATADNADLPEKLSPLF